jgi:vancomycin resistance protein YoaR
MVPAFGGGVCQTSTTLYNAALLAGLAVVERHPHVFAPRYAAPGRDAAVAYPNIDLRFRNPYPWPVRVQARADDERLEVRLFGARRPAGSVEIVPHVLSVVPAVRLTRVVRAADRPGASASGRAFVRSPGISGYRVVTYRVVTEGDREKLRERLSDDTYPAMNRVVQMTDDERPAAQF